MNFKSSQGIITEWQRLQTSLVSWGVLEQPTTKPLLQIRKNDLRTSVYVAKLHKPNFKTQNINAIAWTQRFVREKPGWFLEKGVDEQVDLVNWVQVLNESKKKIRAFSFFFSFGKRISVIFASQCILKSPNQVPNPSAHLQPNPRPGKSVSSVHSTTRQRQNTFDNSSHIDIDPVKRSEQTKGNS